MKKDTKKTIDLLNDLFRINQDRAEAYQKATNGLAVREPRMQNLIGDMIQQSNQFISRIKQEITALGGETATAGAVMGSTYSAWVNVKPTLSSNIPRTLLDYCEHFEEAVGRAYDLALDETGIAETSVTLILLQKSGLRDSLGDVKSQKEQHLAYANA